MPREAGATQAVVPWEELQAAAVHVGFLGVVAVVHPAAGSVGLRVAVADPAVDTAAVAATDNGP